MTKCTMGKTEVEPSVGVTDDVCPKEDGNVFTHGHST